MDLPDLVSGNCNLLSTFELMGRSRVGEFQSGLVGWIKSRCGFGFGFGFGFGWTPLIHTYS